MKSPLVPLISRWMTSESLQRSFTKIFAADSQPDPAHIEVLWRLLEQNNGKQTIPRLLTYIDERHEHAERWLHAMQNTSVAQCFINGVQDPISGLHMLAHFRKVVPNAKTHGLDVWHYPQLEAPQEVLPLSTIFAGYL